MGYSRTLSEYLKTYLILTGLLETGGKGGGRGSEAFLYNFKTAHDTVNNNAQNNVLTISNIWVYLD